MTPSLLCDALVHAQAPPPPVLLPPPRPAHDAPPRPGRKSRAGRARALTLSARYAAQGTIRATFAAEHATPTEGAAATLGAEDEHHVLGFVLCRSGVGCLPALLELVRQFSHSPEEQLACSAAADALATIVRAFGED